MYTVTFKEQQNGSEAVSRYFNTVYAAKKWAKWLSTRDYVAVVQIYRGQAGELLVTTIAK